MNTRKPPVTLLEGQPSIAVKVGAGNKAITWNLPKGLLTHISPFFKAALSRGWFEAQAESVDLPEDDPAAFRLFYKWLYTWTLSKSEKYPTKITKDLDALLYVEAWILGDKLGCPHFQDFAYAHLDNAGPYDTDIAKKIYTGTPEGSSLRRWMTHVMVDWISTGVFTDNNRDRWANTVADINDFATDVLKYQILKEKHTLADFMLVSDWNDFGFCNEELGAQKVIVFHHHGRC
ncbi:MAG: hypothetical protein Q9213_007461 [Squamulea squamosa]